MIRGLRSSLALGLTFGALQACGGPPPQTQPPAAHVAPSATMPPEPGPLLIEYVVIHRRWVEKVVPTTPADVKAWSEAPANADAVSGPIRHILVKVPGGETDPGLAAKKKAESIIVRLDKGEDFAKLASQLSDDPSSKASGGELRPDSLNALPTPIQSSIATLEPGKTAPAPLRSAAGFHIVHKDRASEEQVERAYRKAKAPELAKKLADDLLARFKANAASRAAIAESVEAILGERAASDPDRPKPSLVDRERLKQAHLTAAAKAALETFAQSAHTGDVLPSPAVDADVTVVARAASPR